MYPEHGFLLLFLATAIFLFVRAFNHGVVGMLWAVTGVSAGVIGGWVFYLMIPDLLPDWKGSFRSQLMVSAVVGLIPYLIVRFVAKAFFKWVFNPDGPLSFLADGFGGGILSLIPSLVVAIVLTVGARIGGTWADLRRFEKLSVSGVDYEELNYPGRPVLAMWRDGVERLPMVLDVFDPVDPIDRVPERNLVGLLITSKKEELFEHLTADPESGPLIESDSFEALLADPEITQLNQAMMHFELLQHEEIRTAAADPVIRAQLEELELHRLVDEFLLSPQRQALLKSLER